MKKIRLIILLLPLLTSCRLPFWLHPPTIRAQQIISTQNLCSLPDTLKESSGIIANADGTIWTHADSGNDSDLTLFNTQSCQIIRRVRVNAANNDWEEIALDPAGNLLIGDFGNNSHNRTNLRILKINNFSLSSQTSFTPEVLAFSYEDQTAFPPVAAQKYFDAEAMLAWSDSIYIFTKDFNTSPYLGITRIYAIPNVAGTHVAKLVYVLPTENSWLYRGAITGAAKSADGQRIVLMSYARLFVFDGFQGRRFWTGTRRTYEFSLLNQREAIGFKDDCTLLTTNETSQLGGAAVNSIALCNILAKSENIEKKARGGARVFPNPSHFLQDVTIELPNFQEKQATVKIFDLNGKNVFNQKMEVENENLTIKKENFEQQHGIFFYQILDVENSIIFMGKFLIL
ncbi:MAG: hypothetical protein RL757_789 [Bacteroidota bacterium]|jgi:hypothetical protein